MYRKVLIQPNSHCIIFTQFLPYPPLPNPQIQSNVHKSVYTIEYVLSMRSFTPSYLPKQYDASTLQSRDSTVEVKICMGYVKIVYYLLERREASMDISI